MIDAPAIVIIEAISSGQLNFSTPLHALIAKTNKLDNWEMADDEDVVVLESPDSNK